MWALDADDGSIKWEWTLGGAVVGVAGDADRVYIAGLDNVLRGVNRGNGHQRWQQALSARAQLAPIGLDGAVLVAGLSPPLTLFNTLTGAAIGTHLATAGLVGTPLVDRTVHPGLRRHRDRAARRPADRPALGGAAVSRAAADAVPALPGRLCGGTASDP